MMPTAHTTAPATDAAADPVATANPALPGAGTSPRRVPEHVAKALSPRRIQILNLAARGNTNPEIAKTLHISETAVNHNLSLTYAVMGASDRAHASVLAAKWGLVDLDDVRSNHEASPTPAQNQDISDTQSGGDDHTPSQPSGR